MGLESVDAREVAVQQQEVGAVLAEEARGPHQDVGVVVHDEYTDSGGLHGLRAVSRYLGPRISTRRILPEMVLGSSATKSITRGYL
jgi:hypothetical protein